MKVKASCLCHKVSINASLKSKEFHACHCTICRKYNGTPVMSVDCKDVEILGDQFVKTYSSSDWAERGFCSHCGTYLFYRLKDQSYWSISLGIFEDQNNFKFTTQIYVDYKPNYYEFKNKTKMMTEEEFLKSISN